MFIFSKYINPFNFKNQKLKNNFDYVNYNFNNKNNIIHSIFFIISLNFYFYLYNSVLYKNAIKPYVSFNIFTLFFISKKSMQKIPSYS